MGLNTDKIILLSQQKNRLEIIKKPPGFSNRVGQVKNKFFLNVRIFDYLSFSI
jgi:hypothetical protein